MPEPSGRVDEVKGGRSMGSKGRKSVKRLILLIGLFTIVVMFLVGSVGCQTVRRVASGVMPYQEKSFTVSAMSEQPLSFELSRGDSLEGYVQVVSGGNLDIQFWVTDPYGERIYQAPGRVKGRHNFIFKAMDNGYYTLHFNNSFSLLTDKAVILKYRRT